MSVRSRRSSMRSLGSYSHPCKRLHGLRRSRSIGRRMVRGVDCRTHAVWIGEMSRKQRPTAVLAYTDGACSGNPGPAGVGVVLVCGEHRKELSEYIGEATSNIAELTAVLRALRAIRDRDRHVILHSDSEYTIGVLTQ